VKNNTLGIQISIGSSAFLTDGDSTVDTIGNLTTGFTVNSGLSLFLFEGTIISDNNQFDHSMHIGSIACDTTVLIRGDTGTTCPTPE
jgi:hypothetical protein